MSYKLVQLWNGIHMATQSWSMLQHSSTVDSSLLQCLPLMVGRGGEKVPSSPASQCQEAQTRTWMSYMTALSYFKTNPSHSKA